jgi:protein SCO1/2
MNTRRNMLLGIGATATMGLLAWSKLNFNLQTKSPYLADLGGNRFPNTVLTNHEGNTVKFYDDLIRGKVVAINMMYTDCKGICPRMTANLRQVQKLLGDRLGRDIFMYSISLQPETDTPERLKEYADRHHVSSGWQFLTGTRNDIEQLRYSLGFYDRDPVVDSDKSSHTGMVRIGNDKYERWTTSPALGVPEQILATINHVDPSVVHTFNSEGGAAVQAG